MTIKEYNELLHQTKCYDYKKDMVYTWLKEIIDVASKMNYQKELSEVTTILSNYGKIKQGKVGGFSVKFLIIDPPPAIRENIRNLMYQVYNQRECDIAEGVTCIR